MTPGSLPARIAGVIRSPHATLREVAERPSWPAVLVLTFGALLLSQSALLSTTVGRLALLDQLERTALALGQTVGDQQYGYLRALSEQGLWYATVSALVIGPGLTVATAAVLFGVFNPRSKAGVSFRQVLAVVAHAGVILGLRQLTISPICYVRETLSSPATLAVLFPVFDDGTLAAGFLGAIDLFILWWIAVLAIGMALLYQRTARRLSMAFTAAYLGMAAVVALILALAGRRT